MIIKRRKDMNNSERVNQIIKRLEKMKSIDHIGLDQI